MLRLENIRKVFSYRNADSKIIEKAAIDNLTLQINDGEIFGLLGPNGAGKTTLIRMLTMLSQPTAGQIYYNDLNTQSDARKIKELIGVVPQQINFDQDLTVLENMHLHSKLHHMAKAEREEAIAKMLSYVELSDYVNTGIKALSGGMKRRLLIVRALLHKPSILFLDEPTVALDPQVRRRIWDLIRKMHKMGVTIVLTTHYIEEAQALCDRVCIIDSGKLMALDTPRALLEKIGRYIVEWDGEDDKRNFKIFRDKEEARNFASNLAPQNVSRRHANLEDVFVELTGNKVSD